MSIENDILAMLKKQNRPFSLQTVVNFTESKYSKGKVEKALDDLVEQKEVTYLEVGKSGKLYFVNEDRIPTMNEEEIEELRAKIEETEKEIVELKNLRMEKQNLCEDNRERLTLEEYKEKIMGMQEKIADLNFDENQEIIPDDKMEKARELCSKVLKAWKLRVKMVKQACENLGEMLDKSDKELKALFGLESTKPMKEITEIIEKYK